MSGNLCPCYVSLLFILFKPIVNDATRNGARYTFEEQVFGNSANITSQFYILDIQRNGTYATCTAFYSSTNRESVTIQACVTGLSTAPRDLSVVWDDPYAVVSFQSPVYGGECVEYYVVTAVSEEGNVTCEVTNDRLVYNCTIPSDRNITDFNFTVYSLSRGVDGNLYRGEESLTHYSVETFQVKCGEHYLVNVSLMENAPILVIESRDCIASPENYRIVVTSTDSTQLMNVSFNTTIEQDVGDVVRPNTQYTIRVQLVHISSNTTIDEMNETILFWFQTSETIIPSNTLPNESVRCDCGRGENLKEKVLLVLVSLTCGMIVGMVSAISIFLVMVTVCKNSISREKLGRKKKNDSMGSVGETQGAEVVYDTMGDCVGDVASPETSENMAYATAFIKQNLA